MENKYNLVEGCFVKNKRFFGDRYSNTKKAFFLPGRYYNRVMEV